MNRVRFTCKEERKERTGRCGWCKRPDCSKSPFPRPVSVMKESNPINSSYQGSPSPVLLLVAVILHLGALQIDRLGTYTVGA